MVRSERLAPRRGARLYLPRHGLQVRQLQPGHRLRDPRRSGPGHRRARRGAEPRRQGAGAARRDRVGQDVHHGAVHRAREPADAGDGPQQDPRRPALSGVPPLLPRQRRRVLRQLLRLLPARGLRSDDRLLHREGSDDQRRDRPHAALGDALALRAPRRHHRRQRLVHLRSRLARGLLRDDAAARARPAHRARSGPPQAGRDSVRAQRPRVHPRRLPRARRHHRGLPVVRGCGAPDRALRRRSRRADDLRSADRQDRAQARQGRGLPEDALRDARAIAPSRRSRRSRPSSRGTAGNSSPRARSSRRTACTSARCSISR